MPIMMMNTCTLSGRILNKEENVVGFPMFAEGPRDPAGVVAEAFVFRDEFEKWELMDHVIDKLKEFWSIQYHEAEAWESHTIIIFEDDDYLFVKGGVADTMVILFHQHVFQITAHWREFCEKLQSGLETVDVSSDSPKVTCSFRIEAEKRVEVCWYSADGWHDCIELSWPEWSYFQSVVTANENVFEPDYSVRPTKLATVADIAALVYIWAHGLLPLHVDQVPEESIRPIRLLHARLKEICKNAARGAQQEREGQVVDDARFQELFAELNKSIQDWYALIDVAQAMSSDYPRRVKRAVKRVKELMRNISER